MQTTLPVEVIELIIDEHGLNAHQAQSRDALRSLALVSSDLCMNAYKYLFAELDIVLVLGMPDVVSLTLKCQRTCERLRDILIEGVKFPRIAMVYWLQTVSLTIRGGNYESHMNFCMAPELTGLLQALHGPNHGMSSFKFEMKQAMGSGMDCPYPIQRAEMFNPESYSAFTKLCQSPHLKSLSLVGVVLGSYSLYGAQVKHLYLKRFRFEPQDEDNVVNQPASPPDPSSICRPLSLTTIISEESASRLTNVFQPHYIQPWSLTRLKSLTLSAVDVRAEINLLPQLRSLKVIRNYSYNNAWASDSPFPNEFARTLHNFFIQKQGTVRDLGSVSDLAIEFNVNAYQEFLLEAADVTNYHNQEITMYSNLVDLDLIARVKLQHINFSFRFYLDSEYEKDIPRSDQPSFIEKSRSVILDFFPRLAASGSLFSLDVEIVHLGTVINDEDETTVKCKGSGTGWW